MILFHNGKQITVREHSLMFHEIAEDLANYSGLDLNSTFSFGDDNHSTAPIYRIYRSGRKDSIILSSPDYAPNRIDATFILNDKFCINVLYSFDIDDQKTITDKLRDIYEEYRKKATEKK